MLPSAARNSGMVGPHILSRAVVAATMGRPSTCAALASPTMLCLSSATSRSPTPVNRPTWWSRSRTAALSRVILVRGFAVTFAPDFPGSAQLT